MSVLIRWQKHQRRINKKEKSPRHHWNETLYQVIKKNFPHDEDMTRKNSIRNRRVCSNGHVYYKSTTCPVCPICEKNRKSDEVFLSVISAPARRALENAGIKTLVQLSKMSEFDILKLHGMGPTTIPKLRSELKLKGLSFRN